MSDNYLYSGIRVRRGAIIGCALISVLGMLLLDALIIHFNIYYYSDDIFVLYPVAVHSLMATSWHVVRPLQYLVLLVCNYLYLPLWLGVSAVCVVAATILAGLACERLFERPLPKAGWWILGLANPLLFYLISQPDIVSQALCNVFFAGALFAFISEFRRLRRQAPCRLQSESAAVFVNLLAAALFFTKETGSAAAVLLPAATALIRFKASRLSPTFLLSLLFPVAAAGGWIWLMLKFVSRVPFYQQGAGTRYNFTLDPVTWIKNFIINLAFPVTPLPSSFIAFELLRSVWIGVSLGSVLIFITFILYRCWRQPEICFPLLVVVGSCLPMILVRTDELYPSMIGPFAVASVLLFTIVKLRWLSLAYGILLYAASLGNAVIYCLGADSTPFGLHHLEYSIYGKSYQFDPVCPIGTTAHVGWDANPAKPVPYAYRPDIRGRVTCIR
jgi:hypothetical protein